MQFSELDFAAGRLSDWIVMLLYIGVALLCGLTSRRVRSCFLRSLAWSQSSTPSPSKGYHRRRRLWLIVGVLLAVLAVTVRFGLLDVISEQFRMLAWSEGWYGKRWWVQGPIAAVVALIVLTMIGLAWRRRHEWYGRDKCSITAVASLLLVIILRVLSQHHIDEVLYYDVCNISLGRWAEIVALSVLAITAIHTMRCRSLQSEGTMSERMSFLAIGK